MNWALHVSASLPFFTAPSQADAGILAPQVQAVGRAAARALCDELALAPKPGLVSFADTGSHDDMDAHTFMRSIFALRPYYERITVLGMARAPFAALERCGIEAERHMLAATGGINTHRGAIFMLGLLCAAAGVLIGQGQPLDASALRQALLTQWGDALSTRADRTPTLPGGMASARLGLRSAGREAALGLPTLFETALPAWQQAERSGLAPHAVRLQTLFSVMAVLDDANLAHRGGLSGLAHARAAAQAFLAHGGAGRADAQKQAWAVHRDFVARRLSPGGAADTLAAACWLHRVQAR